MTGDVLGRRALSRALLERQMLLRRDSRPVLDAVRHLVGLQAQDQRSPYLQLWARLARFDPHELSRDLLERRVVRIVVMRGTIHLLTVDDALGVRPLVQPVMDAGVRTTRQYIPGRGGADPADIAAAARAEFDAAGPLTAAAVAERLVPRFANSEAPALSYVTRCLLPLVQLPPRGVWGGGGGPVCLPLETWAGAPLGGLGIDDLVLRYLGAFGPASVADVQAWSGLTRLAEVVDRLRTRLRPFRTPDGVALWDLPDAPRPDPSRAAPVRLIPDFDNVLLSHADRTRVIAEPHRALYVSPNGQVPGTVLVDGFARAHWRIARSRGSATAEITPFDRLPVRAADAAEREARRLLRLTDPDAEHDVRLLDPVS